MDDQPENRKDSPTKSHESYDTAASHDAKPGIQSEAQGDPSAQHPRASQPLRMMVKFEPLGARSQEFQTGVNIPSQEAP